MAKPKKHIALGIITHEDSVLLIRRRETETAAGGAVLDWAFPGGKVEPGEDAWGAVEREVDEETGVDVIAEATIAEGPHPNFPVIVTYVGCRLLGEAMLSATEDVAIAEARWVRTANLRQVLSSPLNEAVAHHLDIE